MKKGKDKDLWDFMRDQDMKDNYHLGVQICLEVAKIVQYIHSRGVVWMDCKLANIIKLDGKWKGIDFDTAMFKDEELTGYDMTEHYASPERLVAGNFVTFPSGRQDGEDESKDSQANEQDVQVMGTDEKEEEQEDINELLLRNSLSSEDEKYLKMLNRSYDVTRNDKKEIVWASKAQFSMDIWSLGVVILEIITQQKLTELLEIEGKIPLSIFFMSHAHEADKIQNFIDQKIFSHFNKKKYRFLRRLLLQIFSLDPEKRPTIQKVLNHSFFTSMTGTITAKELKSDKNQIALLIQKVDGLEEEISDYENEEEKEAHIQRVMNSVTQELHKIIDNLLEYHFFERGDDTGDLIHAQVDAILNEKSDLNRIGARLAIILTIYQDTIDYIMSFSMDPELDEMRSENAVETLQPEEEI